MSKNHFRVLTNEDLKKVSGGGGKGGASTRQIGNITFSGHVGKYNGVVQMEMCIKQTMGKSSIHTWMSG